MQNTPPVTRRFMLWSFQASPGIQRCRKRLHTLSLVVRELVNRRFGTDDWTEWEPGVLESLGADEPTVPASPHPMSVAERARILLDLGMDFARVAEVLQVSGEELLGVLPRADGRVLLPSPRAYASLSAVERLWEASW